MAGVRASWPTFRAEILLVNQSTQRDLSKTKELL